MRIVGLMLFTAIVGCGEESGKKNEGDLLKQTAACAAWVDCAKVVDPDIAPLVREAYGPDGESCWGDARDTLACDSECSEALFDAAVTSPGQQACWENGRPNMTAWLGLRPTWSLGVANGSPSYCRSTMPVVFAPLGDLEFEVNLTYESGWSPTPSGCVVDPSTFEFKCEKYRDDGEMWIASGKFSADLTGVTLNHQEEGDRGCTWEGTRPQ